MCVLFPISQPLTACPWEINILYTEQSLTHRPILVRALEMQRVRLWAWEPPWRSRFIPMKDRRAHAQWRGRGSAPLLLLLLLRLSKMHQKFPPASRLCPAFLTVINIPGKRYAQLAPICQGFGLVGSVPGDSGPVSPLWGVGIGIPGDRLTSLSSADSSAE